MTTWITLFGLLVLTCGVLGAPVSLCPKSCSCSTTSEIYLEARCHSFDNLNKSSLSPEEINAIVALDINNGPATKTNPDLSHLRNLKHLSLTSNKIQHVIASHFPKSLEYLDLSRNSIRQPPHGLYLLPALKEVSFIGNPISCSCDSLIVRDALLEKGIVIAKSTKCESPEDLRGKSWLSVKCRSVENLFGEMQGDEPDDGSGSGDIALVTDSEPNEKDNKWEDTPIEEEFIPVDKSANAEHAPPGELATTEATELEGSGDESEVTTEFVIVDGNQETSTAATDYDGGDDDDDDAEDYEDLYKTEEPPVSEPPVEEVDMSLLNSRRIKACNFNCSTPAPLPDSNETDVSPPPDFFEGVKIVVNDILGRPETTRTTITTTSTTTTEKPTTPLDVPKEQGRAVNVDKNNTSPDAEVIGKGLSSNDTKENINEEPKQSKSTFIFLSVLLLVIVCLVVYAVVKKRSMKRKRQLPCHKPEEKEKIPEEVELIKKVVPENDKPNGTHETIPLMNGHNENQHKNPEEMLNADAPDASRPSDEGEDVELRPKKTEKNPLTPEAKRVTIKASEIPNSTPKTPILVTRHVNSDGSIVTTPNIDQNV